MSWVLGKKRVNPAIQRLGSSGFPGGWNSLAHPSTLKDSELSELINGIYSQYGSISKRAGCRIIGSPMEGATSILNAKMFYDINGQDYMLRINDLGKVEKLNWTTNEWELLTGIVPGSYTGIHPSFEGDSPIFNTADPINMIQYNRKIMFSSPTDVLTIFDGTSWIIPQYIADPTTKATVAKTGDGTGTRIYYYRYTYLNEYGTTLASPPFAVGDANGTGHYTNMPALSADNYLTVTVPAAPAGCTKIAIYRGDVSGNELYLDDIDSDQTTYIDKGGKDVDTAFAVPEENNTGGYHFYTLAAYKDSLVGTTVEEGKNILMWSAALGTISLNSFNTETYMSFALVDGAGFDDFDLGDGQSINQLQQFTLANANSLMIFKDSKVGILTFDSEGNGVIQTINNIRGAISPYSAHLAGNNIRFYSTEGVAAVGHEANYGTILRYSVMSLKADALTEQVTQANLKSVCSEYYKNLSLFGLSTGIADSGNNVVLVYDERYDTWAKWTGLYPSVFFKAIHPTSKIEELYFGDAISGNVLKMFTGKTDYASSTGTGTKITLSLTTKQYDAKLPDKFKKFDRVVLVFGSLTGNNTTVQVITMGEKGIHQYPRYSIPTNTLASGFGNDEWGNQEVGMMTVESEGETLDLRYVNLQQRDLFWAKVNIQNDGNSDEMTLIGVYFYYTASDRELPASTRLKTLA